MGEIGFHIGKNTIPDSDLTNTLLTLINNGIKCFQMFVAVPHSGKLININRDEIRTILGQHPDVHLYVHASYVCHMCSPGGLTDIKQELIKANELGATGFIIHLEKKPLNQNLQAARIILDWSGIHTKVIFEPPGFETDGLPPGESDTFETPQKINIFVQKLLETNDNFGICIDTAHIWSGGVDIETMPEMHDWLASLKYPKMVDLFHLNDNLSKLGGRDLHMPIGNGRIWRYHDGWLEVLRFAKTHHTDIILERGGSDALKEVNWLKMFY